MCPEAHHLTSILPAALRSWLGRTHSRSHILPLPGAVAAGFPWLVAAWLPSVSVVTLPHSALCTHSPLLLTERTLVTSLRGQPWLPWMISTSRSLPYLNPVWTDPFSLSGNICRYQVLTPGYLWVAIFQPTVLLMWTFVPLNVPIWPPDLVYSAFPCPDNQWVISWVIHVLENSRLLFCKSRC